MEAGRAGTHVAAEVKLAPGWMGEDPDKLLKVQPRERARGGWDSGPRSCKDGVAVWIRELEMAVSGAGLGVMWTRLLSLSDLLTHACSKALAPSWNGSATVCVPHLCSQSSVTPSPECFGLSLGGHAVAMAPSAPSSDCSHSRLPEGGALRGQVTQINTGLPAKMEA